MRYVFCLGLLPFLVSCASLTPNSSISECRLLCQRGNVERFVDDNSECVCRIKEDSNVQQGK
jgi:hypothetical protein